MAPGASLDSIGKRTCASLSLRHELSYDTFFANQLRDGSSGVFWLDSMLHPFLTPNGQGVPVFGYCHFSKKKEKENSERLKYSTFWLSNNRLYLRIYHVPRTRPIMHENIATTAQYESSTIRIFLLYSSYFWFDSKLIWFWIWFVSFCFHWGKQIPSVLVATRAQYIYIYIVKYLFYLFLSSLSFFSVNASGMLPCCI